MNRVIGGLVLLLTYLATGLYIIPANEQGVVRRFGRMISVTRTSGLHYDFPWPFTVVDRVNLNGLRTMTLGEIQADSQFVAMTSAARPTVYLTGDNNLLSLRVNVQYRISAEHVSDWLYASHEPVQRLRFLVESTTAELISRHGVEFVQTNGLTELNNQLLMGVRQRASHLRIGCEVEQVTIDRVDPPLQVKAEFLDVSNARADMARSIDEARSYAEQKLAESQADGRKLMENAERERRSRFSTARGSADRFASLVSQIQADAQVSDRSYAAVRQLVQNRLTLEAFRDLLETVKTKIVLEGEKPFDLVYPAGKEDR